MAQYEELAWLASTQLLLDGVDYPLFRAGLNRKAVNADKLIRKVEAKQNVQLTLPARMMLTYLLVEHQVLVSNSSSIDRVSEETKEKTLSKVISGALEEPTSVDIAIEQMYLDPDFSSLISEAAPLRSTVGIVRQFWKHFCNMPPFCAETATQRKERQQ